MNSRAASQVALGFVVLVVGGTFFWWFRERPSYLLYRAHQGIGGANQAAAIAEYRRLLSAESISPADELTYRKALGELYLRAVQESDAVSSYTMVDKSKPASPFLSAAKSEFERVIELDPDDGRAHYYLGRILWLQNLENFAIAELELARAKDPGSPEPLRFLSMIREQRGDAAAARDLALQALSISPSDDDSRMALISAHAALGNESAALEEFERLSPAFRDRPVIRSQHALALARQNHWYAARIEIENAMRAAPQSGWIKITYGQMLLERGLYEEAAATFAQAQALLPRSAWPLVYRARAQALRGECREPLRTGQILTDVFPRWPVGRLVSAHARLCVGDARKALSELDESLRLQPDFPDAALLRAEILLDQERFEQLGRAVRPMLDQGMLRSEAEVLLSRSFLLQGNETMAIELAEGAIRMDQRNHRALAALGLARAVAGDAAGAKRALADAVLLNPDDAYAAAADAFVRADNEAFRRLASGSPRDPHVWLFWGELCLREKRFSDAAQAFQSASSVRPWLLGAHLGMAAAQWAAGHADRAESALSDAAEINSRHREVIAWRERIRRRG